ncbi:hypothetical protein Dxin01_03213 [Deinococcus xinjiangensis]|uniref:Uncharacterized protein n=1 Tax=Deinococcus xinjiangensis TaxID=457454 RepID=A0ABP9VFV6_9DEIO
MNARLPKVPPLPLALVLGVLTLGVWANLTLWHGPSISVVNHSGKIVEGVQICLPSGQCVSRPRLWPHQAWRVPLPAQHSSGVQLQTPQHQLTASLRPELGVQFVLKEGGRVQAVQ